MLSWVHESNIGKVNHEGVANPSLTVVSFAFGADTSYLLVSTLFSPCLSFSIWSSPPLFTLIPYAIPSHVIHGWCLLLYSKHNRNDTKWQRYSQQQRTKGSCDLPLHVLICQRGISSSRTPSLAYSGHHCSFKTLWLFRKVIVLASCHIHAFNAHKSIGLVILFLALPPWLLIPVWWSNPPISRSLSTLHFTDHQQHRAAPIGSKAVLYVYERCRL